MRNYKRALKILFGFAMIGGVLNVALLASAFAAGFGVAGNSSNNLNTASRAPLTQNPQNSQSAQNDPNDPKYVPDVVADNTNTDTASADIPNGIAAANPQSNDAAVPENHPELGDTGMSQEAFATMVRNMMPLSPAQIRTLRALFDQTQHAASQDPGVPPKPTSSSVMVSLSPGSTPPIARLRAGFVSSLVFLDATGKPWPIQAYDNGDPDDFDIQWDKKSNILLVQAKARYKTGNLAVMLKNQDTPVMVTLMPGQRAVDYRIDLRIPGLGPNAAPATDGLPPTVKPQLIDFLNGVPPQGSTTLEVIGGPCQGWMYRGHIYLRTTLTLLSPSWLAKVSSPDGTNVYELVKAPIVLTSYRGQVIQLAVKGL